MKVFIPLAIYIKNLSKVIANKVTASSSISKAFRKTGKQLQNNYTNTTSTLFNHTPIKTDDPAPMAGSFFFLPVIPCHAELATACHGEPVEAHAEPLEPCHSKLIEVNHNFNTSFNQRPHTPAKLILIL